MANPSLSVLGLAMDFFLSERQFNRKLKKASGFSPNNFIREIRLNQAYQMLLSGKYQTVKSVAKTVGYKRVDYFSNLFEEWYNYRPLDLLNTF